MSVFRCDRSEPAKLLAPLEIRYHVLLAGLNVFSHDGDRRRRITALHGVKQPQMLLVRGHAPHTGGAPNADAFAAALRERGMSYRVTAHGSMAVLEQGAGRVARGAEEHSVGANPHTVADLAREHGFTHAALELTR